MEIMERIEKVGSRGTIKPLVPLPAAFHCDPNSGGSRTRLPRTTEKVTVIETWSIV